MHVETEEKIEAVRVNDRYWLINGRLIAAVQGFSGTKPDDDPDDDPDAKKAALDAEQDAKLNAAIKGHLSRERKAIEKLIADGHAKMLEAFKTQAPQPPVDDKEPKVKLSDKEDPRVKVAIEEQEKLRKRLDDAEARAKSSEERSRNERTDGEVRALLDAKGIKGPRATAVIALMKQQGQIAHDEDGNAVLKVARTRTKGGKPEALEFDLKGGIDDWAKTEDAAEFLPPPGDAKNRTTANRTATGSNRAPARRDAPALTDDEAVRRTTEDLERAGVDINDLL